MLGSNGGNSDMEHIEPLEIKGVLLALGLVVSSRECPVLDWVKSGAPRAYSASPAN